MTILSFPTIPYRQLFLALTLLAAMLLAQNCSNSDLRSEGGKGYFWDSEHLQNYADQGKHDDY